MMILSLGQSGIIQISLSDGFVKSPDASLRFILRHCGVRKVRLFPQDLRALPANFLQSRPIFDFLRLINICYGALQ